MHARAATLVGLLASSILLVLAPLAVPSDYSWVRHTLSEAAAQDVPGAWVARLGLALFGVTALVLARLVPGWGEAGRALHGLFGLCLVGSAVFPSRSWVEEAPFDTTLDTLHSIAATAMGFAFAFGVVSVAVNRRRAGVLDVLVVVASVTLPLAMSSWPDSAGLWQRVMFALAYAWFATEALRPGNPRRGDPGAGGGLVAD